MHIVCADMTHSFRLRASQLTGVSRILQFFSLAALTQLVLMLNQVVLLPIQIRAWGNDLTASWYAALAIANIITVSDCGLRLAGHAELLQSLRECPGKHAAAEYFRQIWAWIRILIVAATIALVLCEALYNIAFKGISYPLWKCALTLAFSLETILIVRIMYLDSLSFYRAAEATYFFFGALRLALSLLGLLIFNVQLSGLAWLFLASSVAAVAWQARTCRRAGTLRLFEKPPPKLAFNVLALTRHTLADPSSTWVRFSMPVLVIATLASPVAVTAYVALRAVFGAARITILQLARVASVEYLRIRDMGRIQASESILGLFTLLAVAFGTAFAAGVVTDNLRILSLWLTRFDRPTFQLIAVSFALSAPFYAYQILQSLMFRVGRLNGLAGRLYGYIVCAGTFALIALLSGSFRLYLILLTVSEMLLSARFLQLSSDPVDAHLEAGRRGFIAAGLGSILLLALYGFVRWGSPNEFVGVSLKATAWASASLLVTLGLFAVLAFSFNTDLWRTMRESVGGSMDEESDGLSSARLEKRAGMSMSTQSVRQE